MKCVHYSPHRFCVCFSLSLSTMPNPNPYPLVVILLLLLLLLQFQFHGSQSQQSYVNNEQLDCDQNYTTTLGYVCNGAASSCASYLTFRSNPTYNSAPTIGYLLNADPSQIAAINNISDVDPVPADTLLIVPLNCSCSAGFYQHNASYVLKASSETYFIVSNNTYQGLTTCQAMKSQNPYNYRNLMVDMRLNVPLRCACPTSTQTAAGVRYLLSYLITWGDSVDAIGEAFGGVDNQNIYDANQLTPNDLIFPFTPILVPLRTEAAQINFSASPPPPPPSAPEFPAVSIGDTNSSSKKWVFVGVGIGAACLLLVGFLVWFFCRRRRSPSRIKSANSPQKSADYTSALPEQQNKSWSVSSEGVRYAIGSLTVYEFDDLQKATGFFGEANRIKGSVYRGSFKGDDAAVKIMKGDVSGEINILKQINHSNIIRLSGFCVHQGNTYLVYEYGEKGSLADWLHNQNKKRFRHTLDWKQRVQIAYDIADALNYLHNYTNPPYIHKNLKSSNILLDANLRAKISNFGLARTVEDNQEGLQLTRHVVGTHGYMPPEYIENGLITPKLDVFAFGVVLLELLSGREAAAAHHSEGGDKTNNNNDDEEDRLLYATISEVVVGENVRERLQGFMDPCLRAGAGAEKGKEEYPLDLAYSMAQMANKCVAYDLNSRPTIAELFSTLSKILSSSLDWDPSEELEFSTSLSLGR